MRTRKFGAKSKKEAQSSTKQDNVSGMIAIMLLSVNYSGACAQIRARGVPELKPKRFPTTSLVGKNNPTKHQGNRSNTATKQTKRKPKNYITKQQLYEHCQLTNNAKNKTDVG